MKRIYITGICGFIASNVANKLFQLGYDINGCDSLKFGYSKNLHPKIRWYWGGFENIPSGVLNEYDVLLHMACDNIIYSQTNPIQTFKTNALDSITLVEQFDGDIIYTSTASVYGQAKELPTPESAPCRVSNAYDQSKLILERFLIQRGSQSTLRLSNCWGRNQLPENAYAGVMCKFIDNIQNGTPITVYGHGEQTRDFCHVDDTVDAIIKAIEKPPINTVCNIGSGKETSINELISTIEEVTGKTAIKEYQEPRLIDTINRRFLSIKKAKQFLDWSPKVDLKTGIEQLVKAEVL